MNLDEETGRRRRAPSERAAGGGESGLIDVVESAGDAVRPADARRRIAEPPPVRVVAVADVWMLARRGLERELNWFYLDMLEFARDDGASPRGAAVELRADGFEARPAIEPPPVALGLTHRDDRGGMPPRMRRIHPDANPAAAPPAGNLPTIGPVYRAENVRLRFRWEDAVIERDTVRPIGVEVRSLFDIEAKLMEAELDFERQRGTNPGQLTLLLRDPAGNWIELLEIRHVW